MYNPPQALPFILPFLIPKFTVAKAACFICNILLAFSASILLWKVYGGTKYNCVWQLVLFFSYFAIHLMLQRAQIVPIILIGATAFLYFEQHQRWQLAGVFATFLMVKPQVLYLFWIAIILWILHQRRWKVLIGFSLSAMSISLIPILYNPDVFYLYIREILIPGYFYHWSIPTLGTLFRYIWGRDRQWLQFLPIFFGMAWFAFHWIRHRDNWIWADQMPWLILICLITNVYIRSGDFALCMIPLTRAALLILHNKFDIKIFILILIYIGINIGAWMVCLLLRNDFRFIWTMPSLLFIYAQLNWLLGRKKPVVMTQTMMH